MREGGGVMGCGRGLGRRQGLKCGSEEGVWPEGGEGAGSGEEEAEFKVEVSGI